MKYMENITIFPHAKKKKKKLQTTATIVSRNKRRVVYNRIIYILTCTCLGTAIRGGRQK